MQRRLLIPALTLALVALPLGVVAQVTHTVNQVGTSFSPADLTIQVGDTVRWVWSVGFHTVTNGTGAADPGVGSLFDSPLNSTAPQFEFQFTLAGTVPYFCRPHEVVDMKGTIVVEDLSTASPPDAAGSLRVHGVNPNPFNPRASISFTLGLASPVDVLIYDVKGRLVRTLASGAEMDAGDRELVWDGVDDAGVAAASGVYFFRVRALGLEQVVRGILVR